jgi:hypothetical protein
MAERKKKDLQIECPCCGARLLIDPFLEKVISHDAPPPKQINAPDLGHASDLLREQAARREALFRQSAADEKTKSQLLERKFAEALKKSKDEPITRPTRDIDLE